MKYKIKEFEKISGVKPANLRYYEKEGLECNLRDDNGYRIYDVESSYKINTFNFLLAQGFSIKDAIKEIKASSSYDYLDKLKLNNKQLTLERELIEEKISWNNKVIDYLEKPELTEAIVEVERKPQYFISGLKDGDHTDYLGNGETIEEWVKYLPIAKYACLYEKGESVLGLLIPQDFVDRYQIKKDNAVLIPGGKYHCGLFVENGNPSKTLATKGIETNEKMIVYTEYIMKELSEFSGDVVFIYYSA